MSKKAITMGINIVIILSIAIIFVVVMLMVVYPQVRSANSSLITFGDGIIDMFSTGGVK